MPIPIQSIKRVEDYLWEIPKDFLARMRVPARIYATGNLLKAILEDRSLDQLVNVASLEGIQGYALAMPDIHEGYGFPVGGVAGFDIQEGIISPGGIGYDINCGVRLLRSEKVFSEVEPYIKRLGNEIYRQVPSGVGREGMLRLSKEDLDMVLKQGAERIIEIGYGYDNDLKHIESEGRLEDAEPSYVSDGAKSRGRGQLGTMGAGNHFVEVDIIEKIFDEKEAQKLELFTNQVVILIHTGSRGLGHQVATDYIQVMLRSLPKYNIDLPDPELACAPFRSPEGKNYWQAMCCAANFAWANRQLITYEVRTAWQSVFGERDKLEIVYDVAHNIAKIESYLIDGRQRKLIVHRKGATRAFPSQPVLIPGSMGTYSYVLVGDEKSLRMSFGSTCHGAGRRMSRTKARRSIRGKKLQIELERSGTSVHAGSMRGLAEEAPAAYKDVNEVVEVVDQAGIAKRVARLKPIAVIKG